MFRLAEAGLAGAFVNLIWEHFPQPEALFVSPLTLIVFLYTDRLVV